MYVACICVGVWVCPARRSSTSRSKTQIQSVFRRFLERRRLARAAAATAKSRLSVSPTADVKGSPRGSIRSLRRTSPIGLADVGDVDVGGLSSAADMQQLVDSAPPVAFPAVYPAGPSAFPAGPTSINYVSSHGSSTPTTPTPPVGVTLTASALLALDPVRASPARSDAARLDRLDAIARLDRLDGAAPDVGSSRGSGSVHSGHASLSASAAALVPPRSREGRGADDIVTAAASLLVPDPPAMRPSGSVRSRFARAPSESTSAVSNARPAPVPSTSALAPSRVLGSMRRRKVNNTNDDDKTSREDELPLAIGLDRSTSKDSNSKKQGSMKFVVMFYVVI